MPLTKSKKVAILGLLLSIIGSITYILVSQNKKKTNPSGSGSGSGSAPTPAPAPAPTNKKDILNPGERLDFNQFIVSPNGKYKFGITQDNSPIPLQTFSGIYDSNGVLLKRMNPTSVAAHHIKMQPDGNLCWAKSDDTNLSCLQELSNNIPIQQGTYLQITDNGNLQLVYRSGQKLSIALISL